MVDRARQRRPRVEAVRARRASGGASAPSSCSRWCTSSDFAKKRPHELSGGMRQRTALARALAQDAQVLLMDEPFGALDAMTRDVLHDELESLWRTTGKTVMFVTHNVREAIRLGDRVVLLTSRPGPRRRRSRPSRSNDRGASTRPRSQPSRRRSPTAYAMRWSVMPAGSETLHPVEDPDIAAFEEQFGAGPSTAREGLVRAVAEAARVRVLRRRVAGRRVDRLEGRVRPPVAVHGLRPVLAGQEHALGGDRRRRCCTSDQGLLDRARARRRGRVARLAVEDPALRRRLDDHRPADDAVDRLVPARRSSCSA